MEVASTARPDAGLLREVRDLLDDVAGTHGRRALSDHHWAAFVDESEASPLLTAVTARDGARLVGYAQVVDGNAACSVELAVRPDEDQPAVKSALLAAVLEAADAVPVTLQWWVPAPGDDDRRVAAAAGFEPARRLLQMRRPLPTGLDPGVATRAFRPGEDDAAWLQVNNRAFADHPEQGGWTEATLRSRLAEPWFDAAGFLLHERDGRLAAFCWTKLHADAGPVLGEIYVIAVDPDFQGLGLGRALTLAGLEAISARGVGTGMLYVDAANTAAVGLYEALGFGVHHVDVAFSPPSHERDR